MSESRREQIDRLIDEFQQSLRTQVPQAIKIGRLLNEEKAEVGHGRWGPYFREQYAKDKKLSRATSIKWMRLAEAAATDPELLESRNLEEAYRRAGIGGGKPSKSSKDRPKEEAEPYSVELTLRFTPEQEREIHELIDDLVQNVFHCDSREKAVLRALRFTSSHRFMGDWVDKTWSLAEYLEEQGFTRSNFEDLQRKLAESEPPEVFDEEALRDNCEWGEASCDRQAEWSTVA